MMCVPGGSNPFAVRTCILKRVNVVRTSCLLHTVNMMIAPPSWIATAQLHVGLQACAEHIHPLV